MAVQQSTRAYEALIALRNKGWTIERISEATSLSESTIKNIARNPSYPVAASTEEKMVSEHQSGSKSPFSDDIDALHVHLDETLKLYKTPEKRRENYDLVLIPRIKFDPRLDESSFDGCRLQWLYGHVQLEYAKTLDSKTAEAMEKFQSAIDRYKRAIRAIEDEPDDENKRRVEVKLNLNVQNVLFNQCDPGSRSENKQIIEWFEGEDYLGKIDALLEDEPNNMMLVHSGLVVASIQKDLDAIKRFGDRMMKRYPKFLVPKKISVGGVPSVTEDPDLTFAVKHLMRAERFKKASVDD